MYVQHNIQARSYNHCCSGKARRIKYSECVSVALVIQHAMRIRRVILSSVARPFVPHISTFPQDPNDFFRDKNFFNIKCVFFL